MFDILFSLSISITFVPSISNVSEFRWDRIQTAARSRESVRSKTSETEKKLKQLKVLMQLFNQNKT